MHSIQDVLLILPVREKDSTSNSLRKSSGKYADGSVSIALVIIAASSKVADADEAFIEYRITKWQIMFPWTLKINISVLV